MAVLAVTKGFGPEAIAAAVTAGCPAVGENYAQELLAKLDALGELDAAGDRRPEVHFIGRLQSRKVRALAGVVDVWQTIDRPVLVDEVARRAPGARIMVQVNVSDEPQKGGCTPDEAAGARDRGPRRGARRRGPDDGGADGRSPTRRVRVSGCSAAWPTRWGSASGPWA